jgi:hypothetical protein
VRGSKWGVAALISLAAVVPSAGALARLMGRDGRETVVLGLILQVLAMSCGAVAAKRGSRWWLTVSAVAALWFILTLLLITIGE